MKCDLNFRLAGRKRGVLLVCVLFFTAQSFAQIGKGDLILSASGNYQKSASESGVFTNNDATNSKQLNVGGSFGYAFSDRMVAGFGLDYLWTKETRFNQLYINDFIQMEEMQVNGDGLIPNLFLAYYYPIVDKLYLSANFRVSYGKIKSDYRSVSAIAENLSANELGYLNESSANTSLVERSGESNVDLFGVGINPELTWFVSDQFGLYLGLGGVEYTTMDWESDNSAWSVNFNPSNWNFGLRIKM